jgi:hypothetical protein
MLLCKYFVFIHFPRAGGTFIRETLAKHIPQDWNVRVNPGHETVHEIPEEYCAVPRFGFIRNPWDWYVSVYASWHGAIGNRPKAFVGHILDHVAVDGRNTDFKTMVTNLMKIGNKGGEFPAIRALSQNGIGPMTWVYMNMYGLTPETLDQSPTKVRVKKFERIREDLIEILKDVHAPITEPLRESILADPPMNCFTRSSYKDYYDDELRELVADRERVVVARYGYSYE